MKLNTIFLTAIIDTLCGLNQVNATSCTWIGGASGNWSNDTLWSCGLVPGIGDTVIVSSGTVTLDLDVQVGVLYFSGGSSISGAQTLTISDTVSWSSGTLETNVRLVIASSATCWLGTFSIKSLTTGAVLDIRGGVYHELGKLSFTSNDTVFIRPTGSYFYQGGVITGSTNEVIYNEGLLDVQFDATITSAALKFINNGSFISNNTGGVINVISSFTNNGTVGGTDKIQFNNLTNAGIVSPGLSIDTLTLSSDFNNANSKIIIEIKSNTGPGIGNDLLDIDGPAILSDTLEIQYLDGYTPDVGYCYTILTSNTSITDSFDVIVTPDNPDKWKILYYPTEVVLEYFDFLCPSDATISTDVDVCTYTITDNTFDLIALANCGDATVINDISGTASLSGLILPIGDTVVTWTVDDGNGNTGICSTLITVEDNQAPAIACPANTTVNTDADLCSYTVIASEFDPSLYRTTAQLLHLPMTSIVPIRSRGKSSLLVLLLLPGLSTTRTGRRTLVFLL